MTTNSNEAYVLSGMNETLVGLNLSGWSVKATYEKPFSDEDYMTPKKHFFSALISWLV